MKLNLNQLKEIDENGYVILPDWFSNEEVNNLRKAMKIVFNEKAEANVIEKSTRYWAIWTAPTIITFIGLIYVSIKISVFSIIPFFLI